MQNNDWMFRQLDSEEEERFRQWARDEFARRPGQGINPCWHPVVRNEWENLLSQVTNESPHR